MKKISIEEFSKMKMLSDISFSPSGKNTCFVLTEASLEKNAYLSWIWQLTDKGETKQLTTGGRESGYIFLDDDTLLYKAGGSEVESVYNKLSLKSGKAKKAFAMPLCAGKITPIGKEKYVVLARTYPGYEDMYTGDKKIAKAYLQMRKDMADYEEFDELPYWINGGTFTRGIYYSLYLYDAVKKEVTRLTKPGFSVSDYQITPDNKKIFLIGDDKADNADMLHGGSLWRLDIGKKTPKLIKKAGKDWGVKAYCVGPNFAVVLATDYSHGDTSDGDFFKLSYETNELTPYAEWDRSIYSSIYCDVKLLGGRQMKFEGDTLYFLSTVNEEHPLYKLEDGKITRITEQEGDVCCFDVKDGKILLVGLYDMKPQEIYTACGKQITNFNGKALKGKYVAKPERLNIISHKREIRGFVYKPIDFKPGKKYPTILFIHGGPKSDLGPVYFNIYQYWCSEGYIVICCNPFGSDGRGSVFADMRGMYGKDDFEDFMNFCDAAIEKYPEIDTKNFFETGISYGGFMTNWIIGHTDRFTACVSQAPVSNWVSMSISDIGAGFAYNQCDGTPWDGGLEKVWRASPLKYADKVKTPTMFIHAINDYRCPLPESLQMYAAIKEFGVESKCFLIRGESHALFEIGTPVHRVRYVQEITKWFEQHKTK